MPNWFWTGLRLGQATTDWPLRDGSDGQAGALGTPEIDPHRVCTAACRACITACPTAAISVTEQTVALDPKRCIECQACVLSCPEDGPIRAAPPRFVPPASRVRPVPTAWRRSLHIRHIDAGSCNGCETELSALDNPFYNLHRLGIFFTPSPRDADVLLITGVVTEPTRALIRHTFDAMPEPRWVVASGTCATSGAPFDRAEPASSRLLSLTGVGDTVPVDLWLPGCPPTPAVVIEALRWLVGQTDGVCA